MITASTPNAAKDAADHSYTACGNVKEHSLLGNSWNRFAKNRLHQPYDKHQLLDIDDKRGKYLGPQNPAQLFIAACQTLKSTRMPCSNGMLYCSKWNI